MHTYLFFFCFKVHECKAVLSFLVCNLQCEQCTHDGFAVFTLYISTVFTFPLLQCRRFAVLNKRNQLKHVTTCVLRLILTAPFSFFFSLAVKQKEANAN